MKTSLLFRGIQCLKGVLKTDRKSLVIAALFVLLLVSVGYILWMQYEAVRFQERLSGYQQGYTSGVSDSVYSLLQQTNNCNAATINYGNFTRQVVDYACVKSGQST